jgi:hypothetical protein
MASAPTSYTATALSDGDLQLTDLFISGNDGFPIIDNEDDDDPSLDGLEEDDDIQVSPPYTGTLCIVSSRMQWMCKILYHNSPLSGLPQKASLFET